MLSGFFNGPIDDPSTFLIAEAEPTRRSGDDIFWSDGNGSPAMPPTAQIANPNPQ
jgi:hypothetical protein